jgi:hypothetical protein
LGLLQITYSLPLRFTTLQLAQRFLIDAVTFIPNSYQPAFSPKSPASAGRTRNFILAFQIRLDCSVVACSATSAI